MMNKRKIRLMKPLGTSTAFVTMLVCVQAQTLTWLGVLPDSSESRAYSVSADGAVVVGYCTMNDNTYRAFRWANGAMQNLGTLSSNDLNSFAHGVSADGSVVVGYTYNPQTLDRAFRWTPQTQMTALHPLAFRAVSVSADGNYIVGWYRGAISVRAYRWHNNTLLDLGHLGGQNSYAYDIAADGSVVVGASSNTAMQIRAFRWHNNQMSEIALPQSHQDAVGMVAFAVSADGNVIAGALYTPEETTLAFRWTQSTGTTAILNTIGGTDCEATDISGDGSIIVGGADTGGVPVAIRWTEQTGMQNLNDVYASLLQDGSHLEVVFGISGNGRYIVGTGYNAATGRLEAFLLDTGPRCTQHNGDVNNTGCIDDADLLAVLFAFGETGDDLGRVDTNCDGTVDDADLLTVLFHFGDGCE